MPIFLTIAIAPWLQFASLLLMTGIFALLGFLVFPKMSQFLLERFASSPIAIAYKQIVKPYLSLIQIFFVLAIADMLLLLVKPIVNLSFLEIILSLSVGITTYYLGYQLIDDYFRLYIEDSVGKGRKLDAEFLLVVKVLANFSAAGIDPPNIFTASDNYLT